MASETSLKGQEAELFVGADLARRGYTISYPRLLAPFDLIATGNGKTLYVQVKTARRRGNHIVVDCTDGSGNRYKPGDVDIFAAYDKSEKRIYYVTYEKLAGRREMWIAAKDVYSI